MIYDDVIMRTIIDLPDQQIAALAEFCQREQISRAEAIRRAVETMLASRTPKNRAAAFGAWAQRGNSRKIVDELREEWD